MLLFTTTSTTSYNIDTERRPVSIIIDIDMTAAPAAGIGNAALTTGTTGSADSFMLNIPLKVLAEYSGAGEGTYIKNTNHTVFIVSVAGSGIHLNGDENFTLNLTGLNAQHTYNVYLQESIDLHSHDPQIVVKDTVQTNTTEKKFSLAGVETLVLPYDNLLQVKLYYPESQTQTLTLAELIVTQFAGNDIVSIGDKAGANAVFGFGDYLTLPVGAAQQIEIQLSNNSGMVFYKFM